MLLKNQNIPISKTIAPLLPMDRPSVPYFFSPHRMTKLQKSLFRLVLSGSENFQHINFAQLREKVFNFELPLGIHNSLPPTPTAFPAHIHCSHTRGLKNTE
jgi:hypothetical protein